MKVARTFTIDHMLVNQLKKQRNQSKIVCIALQNYFDESETFSMNQFSNARLMAVLLHRDDVSEALKVMLRHELNLTTTKEPSS